MEKITRIQYTEQAGLYAATKPEQLNSFFGSLTRLSVSDLKKSGQV